MTQTPYEHDHSVDELHQAGVPTLGGMAFQRIRKLIITGALAPGTKIDQLSLANNLAVSIVPVREALRKLEAEGLVRVQPRHGAYVTPISREEMEDLYTMREALEGLATKFAGPKLRAGDLKRLGELILEMEKSTREKDYAALVVLNREFHFAVYVACGRRYLLEVISGLWEKSVRYRSLYTYRPERSLRALEEHKEILRALQRRSIRDAVRAVRKNIRQTMLGLLTTREEDNKVLQPN